MFEELTLLCKIVADICVLTSKVCIFRKMKRMHTVSGISLKWNLVLLVSYVLMYFDPREWSYLTTWNVYNNLVKVAMIEYQIGLLLLMWFKFSKTYEKRNDKCSVVFLVIFSMIFGMSVSYRTRVRILACFRFIDKNNNFFWDLLKNTGHCLNALAIIPQLVMTQESEYCEAATGKAIFLTGIGNIFMLLHNIFASDRMFFIVLGVIAFIINLDFMLLYYKNMMMNVESKMNESAKKLSLKLKAVKRLVGFEKNIDQLQ